MFLQNIARVSLLKNGLRVATLPAETHFQSVGILVNAGSRLEDDFTHGAAHFLDRMTFKVFNTNSRVLGLILVKNWFKTLN
jgi:predicted Zn-dependent peptidase